MNALKIEYDMQELRDGIKAAVIESMSGDIADEIKSEIKAEFMRQVKPEIEVLAKTKATDFVEGLLQDIADNCTISVGGGWDEEPKTYTYRQFVKEEIRKMVASGEIQVKNNHTDGRRNQSVKFDRYVIEYCVGDEVQKHIQSQVDALRKDVNAKVKDIFDTQTRDMLSETVMGVIMQSDTYRRIDSNIKCIADRSEQ